VIDRQELDPLDVSDNRDAHAPDRSGARQLSAARRPSQSAGKMVDWSTINPAQR
jgi:hypothetical protein